MAITDWLILMAAFFLMYCAGYLAACAGAEKWLSFSKWWRGYGE